MGINLALDGAPATPLRDAAPYVRRIGAEERLELIVRGMHCAACIARIERAMQALPGMRQARVNLSTGKVSLAWTAGALAPGAVVQAITRLGFTAQPFDPSEGARAGDEERALLLRSLGITGFASMNVMLLSVAVWAGPGEMGEATRTLFYWISALIAIPATLVGGIPFFRSAIQALAAGRTNMDVPISVAVLGALGLSISETILAGEHAYFEACVMLLFLLLIGRVLDHALRDRARAAARDLLALQSGTALRLDAKGHASPVRAGDIAAGDRLLLMPGDRLPVDARLISGEAEIDRALVTGESALVRAVQGAQLRAGERIVSAQVEVEATARVEDSLLAELTRLIEAGEQRRSAYIRLADLAAQAYVPVVHVLAVLAALGWVVLADAGLRESITIAIAVLIITCPCALGLAVPAVQIVATGRLFRGGVLVKSGDALERLAEADTILIDKTGTLTFGRPRLEGALPEAALQAAAALARGSRHPYARAVAEAAGAGPIAADLAEIPGEGLSGTVNGTPVRLGRRSFVGGPPAEPAGGTEDEAALWLRIGDTAPVGLTLSDGLRPDAADLIAGLRQRGLTVEMLSGDRHRRAEDVARTLGLDAWSAEMTPAGKSARLEALRASGRRIAMIGDGLNDTPVLSAAHVSISFAAAAEASQSAADLVLTGERLSPILDAVDVARSARMRVLENFAISAIYNALAIPIAVFGYVTPLIAAVAMSASSLVVTLNALRLMKGRT